MSDNKVKTTSIARKINWSFWVQKLGSYIRFDLFLVLIFCAVFFMNGLKELGCGFKNLSQVNFTVSEEKEIFMNMSDVRNNAVSLSVNAAVEPVRYLIFVIPAYQLISLIFAMFGTGKIRKKLKPIDELAAKAEAISSMSFDFSENAGNSDIAGNRGNARKSADNESTAGKEKGAGNRGNSKDRENGGAGNIKHLENLEQAIANVRADEDNISIKTYDEDLKGIENSLNNLLRRLKENEKQQVRFVSDASHELRTPIAVIQGYVNMLDRWGAEDPEVLAESIEALKKETEYMKELIEQLLFLARGDSGRCRMNMVDFNLTDVVREVWEESLLIDEHHRYEFRVDGKPASFYTKDEYEMQGEAEEDASPYPVHMMHGDVALIKQSIRVFVTNAAKYTAEGDAVIISAAGQGNLVSYGIQDEGIGIEQKDLDHIFERFYRADEARNGKTGGTGLGLSIAKWIIDNHRGNAEVISRSGLGTRFLVSFPGLQSGKQMAGSGEG